MQSSTAHPTSRAGGSEAHPAGQTDDWHRVTGVQQYGSGELFYIMEQAASRPLDESVQPLQPPHFRQAALHTDESAPGNLVQGDAHNIEHGYAAPPGAAPCHGYGAVSAYDSGCGASGYYGGTTYYEGGGSYAGAGYYMDASGTPVPITFPVGSAGGDEGYYGYACRDGYAYGDVEYADVPHGYYAPQAYDGAGDHALGGKLGRKQEAATWAGGGLLLGACRWRKGRRTCRGRRRL